MVDSTATGDIERIREATISGDWRSIGGLVQKAIDEGASAQTILDDGLTPALDVVGDRFADGSYFIPDLLLAARAMKRAVELLRPYFAAEGPRTKGTVVIGTVEGDLHDIGKNLVIAMLEGAGYRVIDLGFDVKTEQFVHAVREHRPDVVGMSGLLTTTVKHMPEVVLALAKAQVREGVLVAMGGTSVTREFARSSGADIFAEDAAAAVRAINQALDACRAASMV